MSNPKPITTAAWEQDTFWAEAVRVMTGGKKLRADSYLQRLSAEDLESLRACLSLPVPLVLMREQAPKWVGGPFDGNPPGLETIRVIWQAMRQVEVLRNMEADNLLLTATRERAKALGLDGDEQLLDSILTLVGQEVLKKTLSGEDPKNRTAAAQMLLKRSDQKRDSRRIALLEKKAAQSDQAKGILENKELSEEEKKLKMHALFGLR